jgi:hypothetical protein
MFRSGSEHNRTVTQVLGLLDRMGAFVAGRWQRRRARHRGARKNLSAPAPGRRGPQPRVIARQERPPVRGQPEDYLTRALGYVTLRNVT